MSRMAGERWDVCLTPFEALKASEITQTSQQGQAATIPQEPALVLEEDPQHLGDGEDHL